MSVDRRRNLRDMLDEFERYVDQFEKEMEEAMRSSLTAAQGGKPFVAGFTFKIGPEGRPTLQTFGDSLIRGDGFRSPLTEQFIDEKAGKLRLVFDMPGVDKTDIQVQTTEDNAVVTASSKDRKYKSEVKLKSRVDPDSAKAEYRNGVLEISFSLKDKDNKGFTRVDIV